MVVAWKGGVTAGRSGVDCRTLNVNPPHLFTAQAMRLALYGYPTPIEAPVEKGASTEYKNVPANNPYLSGTALTILSKVYVTPSP